MQLLSELTVSAIERIESASGLDPVSTKVRGVVRRLLPDGPIRDLASGVPVGHPAHPMLVVAPLGLWSAALLLDSTDRAEAARFLVGAGVLAAGPAAVAGWSDWLDTADAEQRVGLVHAALNGIAIGGFAASWWSRRHGGSGRALSGFGAVMMASAGWLGGHLAYAMGVGVDTNAFGGGPTEWTKITGLKRSAADLRLGSAGRVRVVVVKTDEPQPDTTRVLADRCSHRGGPLSEGRLVDGCVECPWHGSRFDPATGGVRRGPATSAQPTYEVRTDDSGIEIRRTERRALRKNIA